MKKETKHFPTDHLHHLAFDNSLLPNIISFACSGEILEVNKSAARLLGYSKKILLTKNMRDIFGFSETGYKHLRERRMACGHAAGNITAIKKNERMLPCHVTSVEFTGENNIKKVITTLVDRSQGIRKQKTIDIEKAEIVAANIIVAKSNADATLLRLNDLEHKLSDEISENKYLHSSSKLQQIVFENQWDEEIKLKGIQIADAITEAKELERSDIGKELHDNVNQLLVASRMYVDMARKNIANKELYLCRSSEYILSAIEEIRKLTKGMINDAVINLGLCDAIHNIIHDLMEVHPVKISCVISDELQTRLGVKFNLNILRIVQEQLNNIVKHSKATKAKIMLNFNKNTIILSVSDNGSGFDVTKEANGIGMANIRSRAVFYNGNADFVSQPGKGCILTVTFPSTGLLASNSSKAA